MKLKDCFEWLFPSGIYCIACGSIIDSSRPYGLCDRCVRRFHWANERTCEKCGKILQDRYLHDLCLDCRENGHFFEKGYMCVQYGILERDLLLSFKYGGKAFIGRKLADIMADRLASENLAADLIVPVPMHKKKEKKRGYNQAEIMAACLAKNLSVPYSGKLLLRTSKTAAMSKLRPEERRGNIEKALAIAPGAEKHLAGKKILLVDDIYTTGSTADACTLALLAAGASEVRLACFAAGANGYKYEREQN